MTKVSDRELGDFWARRMVSMTHHQMRTASDTHQVNLAFPHATPEAACRGDDGRVILEALVGLSLIAIAVVGWGRASVTASRAEATADHHEVALELASNAIEEMTVRSWNRAMIDPGGRGAIGRFEGRDIVAGLGGVAATTTVERDGRTFEVNRHITDSGDEAWRYTIVIVQWSEGGRTPEVRLDGAVRRPDQGTKP